MPDVHRVVCDGCGHVLEADSQRLSELNEAYTAQGIELSRKQAQISRLRKAQAEDHPAEYEDALAVAGYWRDLLHPSARELNGPRLLNTIARLKAGYPREELRKAIWGYYCRPNVTKGRRVRHDQGGERRVDLELIMRDASHVDQGIAIADQELRYDQRVLDEGGSRYVASRCDCGHGRGDHGLYRIQGHEACYAEGCDCRDFDDSLWMADSWRAEQSIKARRRDRRTDGEQVSAYNAFDPSPAEVPSQGSLL
jgi:DNA-binding protein H-NS